MEIITIKNHEEIKPVIELATFLRHKSEELSIKDKLAN